jgi:hypothetical protein
MSCGIEIGAWEYLRGARRNSQGQVGENVEGGGCNSPLAPLEPLFWCDPFAGVLAFQGNIH